MSTRGVTMRMPKDRVLKFVGGVPIYFPAKDMSIISVYIVSKAGGLIFSHDQPNASAEVEATFDYPLRLVLEEVDRHVVVKYGEKHGIQGKTYLMSDT